MKSGADIEFGAFNPRRNLPPAVGRKRGESNFVAAFHRRFASERDGLGGRHFEMAGYGIADLVWLDCGRDVPFLMAFEMKLKDWRRALSQAYRYSYFSDCSIVVLPPDTANRAAGRLEVFQRLGIGLWSYEPKTGEIKTRFTPEGARSRNPTAREKAVSRILRKFDFRQGRE